MKAGRALVFAGFALALSLAAHHLEFSAADPHSIPALDPIERIEKAFAITSSVGPLSGSEVLTKGDLMPFKRCSDPVASLPHCIATWNYLIAETSSGPATSTLTRTRVTPAKLPGSALGEAVTLR